MHVHLDNVGNARGEDLEELQIGWNAVGVTQSKCGLQKQADIKMRGRSGCTT